MKTMKSKIEIHFFISNRIFYYCYLFKIKEHNDQGRREHSLITTKAVLPVLSSFSFREILNTYQKF